MVDKNCNSYVGRINVWTQKQIKLCKRYDTTSVYDELMMKDEQAHGLFRVGPDPNKISL